MNRDKQILESLTQSFGVISAALDSVPVEKESVLLAKILIVLCRSLDVATVNDAIAISLGDIDLQPHIVAGGASNEQR